MLPDSVMLVFQNMLTASLLLSILMAFSTHNQLSFRWAWSGIATGGLAACLYASQIKEVSKWFDYVGVDVVNASIQYLLCFVLLCFALLYSITSKRPKHSLAWQVLMAAIVALAITREGVETLLYFSNFFGDKTLWPPVLLGSLLGAGIGISLGALLYYGLVSLPVTSGDRLLLVLLALFGGNMAAHGTLFLIQANWLPSGQPFYDLNFLITEDSFLGRFSYALVGYEATPTALQTGAYGLQALLMLLLFGPGLIRSPRKD